MQKRHSLSFHFELVLYKKKNAGAKRLMVLVSLDVHSHVAKLLMDVGEMLYDTYVRNAYLPVSNNAHVKSSYHNLCEYIISIDVFS